MNYIVTGILGDGLLSLRLLELGFIPGTVIQFENKLKDMYIVHILSQNKIDCSYVMRGEEFSLISHRPLL